MPGTASSHRFAIRPMPSDAHVRSRCSQGARDRHPRRAACRTSGDRGKRQLGGLAVNAGARLMSTGTTWRGTRLGRAAHLSAVRDSPSRTADREPEVIPENGTFSPFQRWGAPANRRLSLRKRPRPQLDQRPSSETQGWKGRGQWLSSWLCCSLPCCSDERWEAGSTADASGCSQQPGPHRPRNG